MLFALIVGVLALLYVIYLVVRIARFDPGNKQIQDLSRIIHKGARSFLFQEYSVFFPVVFLISAILLVIGKWQMAVAFVLGSGLSTFSGFVGMSVATSSNGRTCWAATKSIGDALRVAFFGGSVMGLTVSSLGVLGLVVIYALFKDIVMVSYYSLGASMVALFARVGGGIYTKAADVGADIVGKTEANLPEDDPRNPAVIADNVGDNVGDVAGMGADLYESYIGSIFSALMLGILFFPENGFNAVMFIIACGLAVSIVGSLWVALFSKRYNDPSKVLRGATLFTNLTMLGVVFIYCMWISWIELFFVVLAGVSIGVFIGLLTEIYTSGKKVSKLAESAAMGPANVIINGIALGMSSSVGVTLLIAVGVIISYKILGLFGVALAGVGMLSTLGMNLSIDAYGPIADNAGGIAQMSGLSAEVRKITDKLDALGNTTAAMGKGFAIGSAAMTALALFSSYSSISGVKTFELSDPALFLGALIGAMLPFFFSALTMRAVGNAADSMVAEIRRQLREMPGILSGETRPDYERCVQIATRGALRKMLLPALLAVVSPVACYGLVGKIGVAGLLIGSTVTGVMLAVFMANSGGAWDNAKKYVEEGHFGGKGSLAHMATVVGDTVGDPFKDTAGPSINILIKLMSIVSIVFITLLGR